MVTVLFWGLRIFLIRAFRRLQFREEVHQPMPSFPVSNFTLIFLIAFQKRVNRCVKLNDNVLLTEISKI